jgi:hypothetical protein
MPVVRDQRALPDVSRLRAGIPWANLESRRSPERAIEAGRRVLLKVDPRAVCEAEMGLM